MAMFTIFCYLEGTVAVPSISIMGKRMGTNSSRIVRYSCTKKNEQFLG